MKALVGAFNQEKALVGAFSVIVQPVVEPMDRFAALAICYAAWLSPPGIQQLFDTNILSDAKYRALDSGDQVAHFSRRNLIQTSFLEHVFGTNSLCDEQEVTGGTSTSSGGHSHVKLERVGCLVLLHLEPVTLQHEVIIPHFYQALHLHTNKEGFYRM